MMLGVDISENNGAVDFQALVEKGVEFVIIRLGYGNRHLDSCFWQNYLDAKEYGLKIGVYYYDYGLDAGDAEDEANFLIDILSRYQIAKEDLEMGIWYDMEDADGWKARHGMPNRLVLTAMCSEFICVCNRAGFSCGIYASLDWLENNIATDLLADYVPYWVAQWSASCDFPQAVLWQFTDSLEIDGKYFDGNYKL